jgi:nitroreductase
MTEQFLIRLRKIADTDHEIFPLLKQRYSPHVFKKERITDSHLKKMFEAVRWSASAENSQPWRFIYATLGTEAYSKIVDCLYDHQKKWASATPLLILNAYKEKIEEGRENFHPLFDLGLGVGNMTVQAQYMGIALHLITEIDEQKARELFQVPPNYQITSVIAAGYYGGDIANLSKSLQKKETQTRHRIPQEDFAFREHWKG